MPIMRRSRPPFSRVLPLLGLALGCEGSAVVVGTVEQNVRTSEVLRVVYPLDGSVHPPNERSVRIQWYRENAEQRYFRIDLERPGMAVPEGAAYGCGPGCVVDRLVPASMATADTDGGVHLFVLCPGRQEPAECTYDVPTEVWGDLAFANRGEALTVRVVALDDAGRAVAQGPSSTLAFTATTLDGGFYYWSTDDKAIFRIVFGAASAEPFVAPDPAAPEPECVGCHAMSRNGRTIAFTRGLGDATQTGVPVPEARRAADLGHLVVADTQQPDAPRFEPTAGDDHDSSMMALSPDGSRVLVAYDPDRAGPLLPLLELRDSASGSVLWQQSRFDGGYAYFPEFGPCGFPGGSQSCAADSPREVVVTLGEPDAQYTVIAGSVAVLPYRDDDTLGPPEVLVAGTDTEMHYYPSWSPDGKWIAFVTGPKGRSATATAGRVTSYDQPDSRLRLVSRANPSQVYELTNATQSLGATSTWPKFAPFGDETRGYFLTFNSKIDYGFELPNSRLGAAAHPQLWLSVIDVTGNPEDPSKPPVWLPFQDVEERNHLGYWTTTIPCREQEPRCGPGQFCSANDTCQVNLLQ